MHDMRGLVLNFAERGTPSQKINNNDLVLIANQFGFVVCLCFLFLPTLIDNRRCDIISMLISIP